MAHPMAKIMFEVRRRRSMPMMGHLVVVLVLRPEGEG